MRAEAVEQVVARIIGQLGRACDRLLPFFPRGLLEIRDAPRAPAQAAARHKIAKDAEDPAGIEARLFLGEVCVAEVEVLLLAAALGKAPVEDRFEMIQRLNLAPARFIGEENARILRFGRMEPDHGHVLRQRLCHDLRGAAPARGRFAIPDGNQEIGLLQHHAPGALVSGVFSGAGALHLKHRRGLCQQRVKFVAGSGVFEVVAVLGGEERQRALQVRAQGEAGVGHNAVRAFGQRREDAQQRGLGRIQLMIVRGGGQIRDGLENLLALARKERRRQEAAAG